MSTSRSRFPCLSCWPAFGSRFATGGPSAAEPSDGLYAQSPAAPLRAVETTTPVHKLNSPRPAAAAAASRQLWRELQLHTNATHHDPERGGGVTRAGPRRRHARGRRSGHRQCRPPSHDGGVPVELTPKEFDFLALLARHQGKVPTNRHILQRVWGPEAAGRTEYLGTYANQLRKKLEDDPASPRLVTEPEVGYRLVARNSCAAAHLEKMSDRPSPTLVSIRSTVSVSWRRRRPKTSRWRHGRHRSGMRRWRCHPGRVGQTLRDRSTLIGAAVRGTPSGRR
jgi:DNA-binding winged helix-turn-helix (wHTH) protein